MIARPEQRGLVPQYRPGGVNRCAGCGGTHWHIGSITAECARCSSALPLPTANRPPVTIIGRSGSGSWAVGAWRR